MKALVRISTTSPVAAASAGAGSFSSLTSGVPQAARSKTRISARMVRMLALDRLARLAHRLGDEGQRAREARERLEQVVPVQPIEHAGAVALAGGEACVLEH